MIMDTYVGFKTLVSVSFLGETVVLVGGLSIPGLACHPQDGDRDFPPVCFTIPNFAV